MTWQKITTIVIAAATILIIGYDIVAFIYGGEGSTISLVLYHGAQARPIIPFAFGVLCGHLFWQNSAGLDGKLT